LKNDRARIQVGRISHFGLLEMSRQRIRTGVLEGSTVVCAHCQGAGVVRSTASLALHVLRVLEDALIKSSTHDLIVRTRSPVALYILNQKRLNLRDLEARFGVVIVVEVDDSLTGANYHAIERGEPATGVKSEPEIANVLADDLAPPLAEEPAPVEESEELEGLSEPGSVPSVEDNEVGRRRRRRRRRRGERSIGDNLPQDAVQPNDDGLAIVAEIGGDIVAQSGEGDGFARRGARNGEERHRRSRGPRGERNRLRQTGGEAMPEPLVPGFDSPPSLALEREFAASEGDYSLSPPPEDRVFDKETTAEPARVAVVRAVDVEAPARDVTSTEPIAESSTPGRADLATEAPASAPAASEPPRPRRSGWWQRARATVIGK
jgi:ribonuclease E